MSSSFRYSVTVVLILIKMSNQLLLNGVFLLDSIFLFSMNETLDNNVDLDVCYSLNTFLSTNWGGFSNKV